MRGVNTVNLFVETESWHNHSNFGNATHS